MVFYDNYVRMCNKVKKSPSAAAEEMGMKRSVVTAWKNGRSPRAATLQRIADYFGCSTSELLGEKEKAPSEDGGSEELIIQFLLSLPHERLRGILLALNAPSEVLADLDRIEPKE